MVRWLLGTRLHLGPDRGVLTLLAAITLALLGAPAGAADAGVAQAAVPATMYRDWLGDVIEVIDDVVDDLDEAEREVKSAEGEELAGPAQQFVGDALDDALMLIDIVLDPDSTPSLDPAEAGAVDTSVDPQTLDEYAEDTLRLANAALFHMQTAPAVDAEYVGTMLKTIEHLILRQDPHGYRSLAGVE